ncbi:hypothetical protein [Geothrix sp. PMB-07]|uniref:hypothetical protein n=1 Tax=Geothrix sp. PMB-07 TaxID=3068640 RepID=UPI0027414C20|nr:hypothetical protein [Geothrix sp. PMB-07]WLT32765.1 hypothetical protein Q9293_05385 [Geothrix sp. PMB-07]
MRSETSITAYGEARQESFRRRVLQARLARLEQEMDALLGDIALLNRLCLLEATDRLEERLTSMTREALRHRVALEGRTPLVEVLAPRLAEMVWAS